MPVERTELVLGQGDVFFGRFPVGTMDTDGEDYLGNTLQFQVTRDITTVASYDSIGGQKVAVEGPIVSETHTVKFNTDNITTENLARWYGGDPIDIVQPSAAAASESLIVRPGRYYQLGTSSSAPTGLRSLSDIVATKAGVPIDVSTNFEIEEGSGRIYVLGDAADVTMATGLTFTYNVGEQNYRRIISSKLELHGSLRFVAQNRYGRNRNLFMPYVHLKVEGTYDMKLEEWQTLTFTAEGRRRDSRTEYVYIDEA